MKPCHRKPSRFAGPLLASLLILLAAPAMADVDPVTMALDDLLKVSIVSAPKFADNPDQIPSKVSILTAEDIRLYGWRTLSDALRSLQGFNVTSDHTYDYIGMRGITNPGDFRPRLQILIDGMPINDNIQSTSPSDTSFPLDIGLVDHIEVIRGPSASIYGGDAMFGVINVVTRSGQSVHGGETRLILGSGSERRLRATWGGIVDGKDVLISFTGADVAGRSLILNDLNASGNAQGIQRVLGENGEQLFVKVKGSDWNLIFTHARRDREVPSGTYGTLPNDRGHTEADTYSILKTTKDWILNTNNTLQQSFYAGTYGYDGKFPYAFAGSTTTNIDKLRGSWWGFENRLVNTAWSGQRWTMGFEFKANVRQDMYNHDQNNQGVLCVGAARPDAPCLDSRQQSQQATYMVQDEIQIGSAALLTLGLRHDNFGSNGHFTSPRLGLIVDADNAGLFKFLYGTAFRAPSVYERFYSPPGTTVGNPDLQPEKMRSLEFSWEKRLSQQSRLSATAYHFQIEHMIGADAIGLSMNSTPIKANGLELEYEYQWTNGTRLRTGYTVQRAAGENGLIANSPQQMAKLNLAFPTGISHLMAGSEAQWISTRKSDSGTERVASYFLANLNLVYAPAGQNWDISLGIRNLFDQRFVDPVLTDNATAIPRWQMPQIGRSFMLRSTLRF